MTFDVYELKFMFHTLRRSLLPPMRALSLWCVKTKRNPTRPTLENSTETQKTSKMGVLVDFGVVSAWLAALVALGCARSASGHRHCHFESGRVRYGGEAYGR